MNESESVHRTFYPTPRSASNNFSRPLPPARYVRYLGILGDSRRTRRSLVAGKTQLLTYRLPTPPSTSVSKRAELPVEILLHKLILIFDNRVARFKVINRDGKF